MLLVFRRTLGDLRKAFLIENSIVLLQFDHGLLSKSIDLVLILLIQNRHGVQYHKDYVEQGQEIAAAPKNRENPQTCDYNQKFLQVMP